MISYPVDKNTEKQRAPFSRRLARIVPDESQHRVLNDIHGFLAIPGHCARGNVRPLFDAAKKAIQLCGPVQPVSPNVPPLNRLRRSAFPFIAAQPMMARGSGSRHHAVESGINTEYNAIGRVRLTHRLRTDQPRAREFIHNHPVIAGMTTGLLHVAPAV
jgi:hypothetical protein